MNQRRLTWWVSHVAPRGEPQPTLSPDYATSRVCITVRELDEDDADLLRSWLEDNVGRVLTFDLRVDENDHDCPTCMCETEVSAEAEVVIVARSGADLRQLVRAVPVPSHAPLEVAS